MKTTCHVLNQARKRSIAKGNECRFVWIVIRNGKMQQRLIAKKGDHVLLAFRQGLAFLIQKHSHMFEDIGLTLE